MVFDYIISIHKNDCIEFGIHMTLEKVVLSWRKHLFILLTRELEKSKYLIIISESTNRIALNFLHADVNTGRKNMSALVMQQIKSSHMKIPWLLSKG